MTGLYPELITLPFLTLDEKFFYPTSTYTICSRSVPHTTFHNCYVCLKHAWDARISVVAVTRPCDESQGIQVDAGGLMIQLDDRIFLISEKIFHKPHATINPIVPMNDKTTIIAVT